MDDLTGKQLGPYQIIVPLGEGGMAAVYKGYHAAMERYVALKILPRHFADDPQFVTRFKQEAKVLAQLQHPHILPVFDFGEADGYTYLVMPFIKSGTLTDLLQGKPLSFEQIRTVISQVGGALDYAHAHGLVHRDVKPSNVLLDESGNCLLSDFGLAKIIEASEKLTMSGAIMGTPAYMSPEQGMGKTLDGRSDIYSLGVILYEMATGRPPYKAETPMAVMIKHISDPLPPPSTIHPDFPDEVEAVILKALAKNPDDRYQTAGAMVKGLQAALAEVEHTSPTKVFQPEPTVAGATIPAQAAETHAKPLRQQRALPVTVLAIIGLVAVIAIGVVLTVPRLMSEVVASPTIAQNPVAITAAETLSPTETSEPKPTPVLIPTKPDSANTPAATATIAGSSNTVPGKVGKICLATGSDVNDHGFNENAWTGVRAAVAEYGAQAVYQVSSHDDQRLEVLDTFLKSNCDVIIAVGFWYGDAVKSVALSNPSQKFAILDFAYDTPLSNVWQQVYATDQASFLAGYVAASESKTGEVGTFGGLQIQPVTDFMDGFALGVAHYNQKNGINVEVVGWNVQAQTGLFTDDFGSSSKGQEATRNLLHQGADIVFPVAGITGYGAGEVALKESGVRVIGVDTDWVINLPQYANVTLTSVEKRFGNSVKSIAQAVANDTFGGGVYVGTLDTGETGIAPFHGFDTFVSAQVKSDLEQITADIVAGNIKTKP